MDGAVVDKSKSLHDCISSFKCRNLLVVGDAILDCYLYGTSRRLCKEAPVPVVELERRLYFPGGAANVAVNAAALGAKVSFLSVAGRDSEGDILRAMLAEKNVDITQVVDSPCARTAAKHRVICNGQMLTRFDQESTVLDEPTETRVIEELKRSWQLADGIIISDYSGGLFTPRVHQTLEDLRRASSSIIVVDSRKRLAAFKSLLPSAVKPNFEEASALLSLEDTANGKRIDLLLQHGESILELTGAEIAAVTLDCEGSLVFEKRRTAYRTYTINASRANTSGAGDTYVSSLALALTSGADATVAGELASAACAVVLGREGTSTCSAEDLLEYLAGAGKYVRDRKRLQQLVLNSRRQGKTIVFTNGCFDILHSGHVSNLNRAKSLGDILIVAVNGDESIRKVKGEHRPINGVAERIGVLSALSCVEYLIDFEEDTACALVELLRPDVFVKGADHDPGNLPEVPLVESYGGRVEILPLVENRSTSALIGRIRGPREPERRLKLAVPAKTGWRRVSRVLAVRLDTIGDVLMTTPAIRALKNLNDSVAVSLLTSSPAAPLAGMIPEIEELLVCDVPWMKRSGGQHGWEDFSAVEMLRRYQFDAAVIFTTFTQSPLPAALLCCLAGIPLRLAHCRENPYQLLSHWVKETEPASGIRHEVERQLALVKTVGGKTDDTGLSLQVPATAKKKIAALLAREVLSRSWIVLHPGASALSRRYPAEQFAEVAEILGRQHGVCVIITGAEDERALALTIKNKLPEAVNLCGALELPELAALIQSAPLLLTNNTGPAHIAAALGTPVVDLYALTNPQHTPWRVPNRVLSHDVACKNCFKSVCPEGHNHCLTLIDPVSVVQAVMDLLAETSPKEITVNA